MGIVLRAREPGAEPVAIKLLTAVGESARRRLVTELRALTRLRHPHLVRVLGAGEHEGRAFLVMEYVEGQPLSGFLEREGPLAPRRAVAVARALARALDHCHRHGVLHRDLKPQNVLLDRLASCAKLEAEVERVAALVR